MLPSEYSERFHQLVDEIKALHDKKMQDYGREQDPYANVRGSQDFGVPPWVGALLRGNDKMNRLKTLAIRGSLSNESAKDSMLDLAVYALIGAVLYEEATEATTSSTTCVYGFGERLHSHGPGSLSGQG